MKSLIVFGTRPEAIKMAPLIQAFQKRGLDFKVCVTGQHRQILDQVLTLFEIKPDYDLNVMGYSQTLSDLTIHILDKLQPILDEYQPDIILVHGDTTTAFVSALASYYRKIKIAHIEAGLRTGNLYSPWPEEANRKLISSLAHYHFAPTETAKQNLLKENVDQNNIYVTGNTIVDALFLIKDKLENNGELIAYLNKQFSYLGDKKIVLITGHRRESFGKSFENICSAILDLAKTYPNIQFVYPVHLNPNVSHFVHQLLSGIDNIHLIAPQDYVSFVYLMNKSYLILTDSGGVQEEATLLGKPVLVMRETTERLEAMMTGNLKLVGTETESIIYHVKLLLDDPHCYKFITENRYQLYGDGHSAEYILNILENQQRDK